MKILFIQTGGTIDKDYPKTSGGYAFEFGEPATQRILNQLNPTFRYEILTAFQKDSLEITDDDRELLVSMLRKRMEEKIIITHGTDTISQTAQYLAKNIPDKCIVLTGAMRPERFSNSDAPINLGMAIAGVQVLQNATYVVIQGIIEKVAVKNHNGENSTFF